MIKNIQRLEQNGIYNEPSDHYELFITKVMIYVTPRKLRWIDKNGVTRIYNTKVVNSYIRLPIDIIRHLNLKHKDRIEIAIRKKVNEK